MRTVQIFLVALTLCLPARTGEAQLSSGPAATVLKEYQPFSATLESITIPSSGGPGRTNIQDIVFADGKARIETYMQLVQDNRVTPAALADMKNKGIDQMIAIERPDLGVLYVIYPKLEAYAEVPFPQLKEKTPGKPVSQMTVARPGKEVVDGHSCVVKEGSFTDQNGEQKVIVWLATDLKDQPVKIELPGQNSVTSLVFRNVRIAKPAANMFEPPSGYRKYSDPRALVREELIRRNRPPEGEPKRQ